MKLRNKKTGEIVEYEKFGFRKSLKNGWEDFIPTADSLTELNEDWEDYTPKEPLIKDEKIRKAVRAWLEANSLDGATFHTSSHFLHYWALRGFNDNGQGVDIDFFMTEDGMPNLINAKYYTKFELCGEEEE